MVNAKMNALQINLDKHEVILVSTEVPKLVDETDVIVRIAYAGVCGTDLHIMEGKFPAKNMVTLGHEMCGTVYNVSKKCDLLKVGDNVVVNPNRNCNLCVQCKRGKFNLCVNNTAIGIVIDGGWAQYCRAPIYLVSKLPDTVPLELGVLCEPLSCIIHGLDVVGPIEIGSTIVILGAGIIGVLFSCLLHLLGHKDVYVSSPNVHRNKFIEQLNFGYKVSNWKGVEEHSKKNPDWQIDVCIDCSGNASAMQEAVKYLRPGGKLCIFGVSSPDDRISISPFDLYKNELTVVGVAINTASSFERTIKILQSLNDRKYMTFEKIGIKAYPLDDYKQAFGELKKKTCSKVVFKVGS